MLKELMRLWFCMKGLFENLSVDISFFPTIFSSSWAFLENCAKFYPTITNVNTNSFVSIDSLEYLTVSNDFSLLSLSLYINLLFIMFKRCQLMKQAEFSVYPQKLLMIAYSYKILPTILNAHSFRANKQLYIIS
jgi:hypothetical protein